MQTRLTAPHVSACSTSPDCEIAVIVPVYKGEAFLTALVKRLHAALQRISESYQIILVDDRSPDGSWQMIMAESQADARVIGIRLSRNFGQHPAISAGIAHANAKWYVVMDCDLQDPPEQIVELYQAAKDTGDDVVIAERSESGLGVGRNIGSTVFNSALSWASGLEISSRYGNFRIFSHRAAEAFCKFPEQLRLFPAIMSQIGFRSSTIVVERAQRSEGSSSYNLARLAKLALETIVAYSEKPLWIMAGIGSVVCALAFLYGLFIFTTALVGGVDVPGFTTLAVLLSFFGGLQTFLTSLVGLYVGRTLDEAKSRPIFIVDTTTAMQTKGAD